MAKQSTVCLCYHSGSEMFNEAAGDLLTVVGSKYINAEISDYFPLSPRVPAA